MRSGCFHPCRQIAADVDRTCGSIVYWILMKRRRIRWRLIGVLALVLLFAIVILQNTQIVDIRVLFWQLSMSRIILLLFSLVVGFVVGYYIKSRRRGTGEEHAIVRPKEGQ